MLGLFLARDEEARRRLVTRDVDGSVWLDIRAFSRPAAWYAKLAGPVGRLLQSVVTDLYVRAGRRV